MSYAFFYDDILNDRRYERELAALEVKLTSLDIQGRVARLALFRNAKDLVDSMVSHGVTTIVAVGDDRTLDKIMGFMPDLDVTLGYLPIEGPTRVGGWLGIPSGIAACDVLAARLVETVDIGMIDGRYFLTEVTLPGTNASVDIEGRYRISAINGGTVTIRNIGGVQTLADAKDGFLEVVITPSPDDPGSRWKRPTPREDTKILIRHGEILSAAPVDVRIDEHTVNGTRFKLDLIPKKLKLITGRSRRLSTVQALSKPEGIATLPTA